MASRTRLKLAAVQIAANFDKPVSPPWAALRKLAIAPRWIGPGVRAPGLRRWKAGELIEFLRGPNRAEELGDIGYYIAQTWDWLWWVYETVTPDHVIEAAVQKFERRARAGIPNCQSRKGSLTGGAG
jgi:hypothetical protein